MKNILNYQTSEYDCGPTTLINAFRYLFEREQLTPELLKTISMYTLDAYDEKGESGKNGTSKMAMKFISSWLNQYGITKNFPVFSEFLEGEQVYIGQNSGIIGCLQQRGVVVARVWLEDVGHYVLLNDVAGDVIEVFDPYYIENFPDNHEVSVVEGLPGKLNRRVKAELMNRKEPVSYAFGPVEIREAMLIYNTTTRKTEENSIEYII
ncbi:C39 family peptidase [Anaerocolumna aminovalerica]|uniref:Peptidase_C39 like family protein n=1 Tax=Anaerocolumna aminovalerica TaxID=1527 RepID=A0A1I5D100_9FIRM|nr:hypothetical protein [Anaerocolumna aminovalerica]SFN92561.1 hypothetical protein SAMN04489757_104154 [Anaerocolumna aminovalerica]